MDQQLSTLLQALGTMYSNAEYSTKQKANDYLQQFRQSQEAWTISHLILDDETNQFDLQTKLFAAQTLRAKISFNLSQVPSDGLDQIKDSLIKLIISYTTKNIKVIRTQLNIALVSLSLQHLSWENPVADIIAVFEAQSQQNSSYTNAYLASLFEFLKILPEECSDINKTPLSDSDFAARTSVLISKNKANVLQLLIQLSTSEDKQTSAAVLDCLNSWITEIPITKILSTASLYQLIFNNLLHEQNFDLSIEALISIIKETQDIENLDLISDLYQELIKLKPLLFENFESFEIVKGLTRLFVEIGECWNASIIKNPEYFKDLIEILLKCCEFKDDLDVIRLTFNFWDSSAIMLEAPAHADSKKAFAPVFLRLIEIIIDQLEYPESDDDDNNAEQSTKDLFDGDLEAKEKFVEFRYDMGDVLKACCLIVGSSDSLAVPYNKLQNLAQNEGAMKFSWQKIEAPLFSMRSMANKVDSQASNDMLNNIFQLLLHLIQSNSPLIQYNRIKYAVTLVFGRYTEYTSNHPSLLEPQLDFIFNNLNTAANKAQTTEQEKDLLVASSNSLMYFCQDCASLLVPLLDKFYEFYTSIKNNSNVDSSVIYEITDGISHVINAQPSEEETYNTAKIFLQPTLEELNVFNQNAPQILQSKNDDDIAYKTIADKIELVTILLTFLEPMDYQSNVNRIADLVIEVFPLMESLFTNFKNSFKISERIVKFLKVQIEVHTTYLVSILPRVIDLVSKGYETTKYGCYLWLTGIIIKQFNDDYVSDDIKQGVFNFGILQGKLFSSWLIEQLPGTNIPLLASNDRSSTSYESLENERSKLFDQLINVEDKVEDFFRMLDDLILQFPFKVIGDLHNSDSMVQQSFQIGILALNLDKYDPVINTIRFLIDFVSWGNEVPPISMVKSNPIEVRETVCKFLLSSPAGGFNGESQDTNGLLLFNMCFKGLLFKFPRDAEFETYDLVNRLVKLVFVLSNNNVALIRSWVEFAIEDLPLNSVSDQEKIKTLGEVEAALSKNDFRKFKACLKLFINYYWRKHAHD
ncbi:Mtr10 protein [Saccharomycopsis crataegensis]|uniref:Mtr10 protein n=1 Tax=Saccharomycopsis crataegensis TaxID=43959 RepID=A0AAV5QKB4_9ASCO|nr:Mtr10 protein [Saccharomycopsis crataegensis]